jgi:hypothetical protein
MPLPGEKPAMSRPVAAARHLAFTSGRSALGRALPLYLAIGVASIVLFGGNGLDARTVTAEAERSRSFRCVLLAAWWLAALPVGRAWIGDPAALSLRALPVARALVLALLALGCLTIQLPWAVLWLRGASASTAVWALSAALALQLISVAGVRSTSDAVLLGVVVASYGLGPHAALTAACLFAFCRALDLAWRRAPEPSAGARHWVVSGSRALAYASALAAATLRAYRPVFARALGVMLASALLPALYIQRNGGAPLFWALAFWGPACILGATAVSGPLLRVEGSLRWLARVCGAEAAAELAPWALLGFWGALTGAAFALVMGQLLHLALGARAGLAAACAGGGSLWALASLFSVRRTTRGGAERAGQLIILCVGLALASLASLSALLPR